MARDAALARSALFEGLSDDELDVVAERMRARLFAPDEVICNAGEQPDRIWLLTGGLVSWTAAATAGGDELVLRMRKGDVIGAQDALTGKERSATVVASMRTSTLELDAEDLVELARRFPQILINLIQTQRERLFRASARSAAIFSGSVRSTANRRGEELGIVAGTSLGGVVGRLVAAAQTATARPVTFLDRSLSFAGALTASDELATENATVLIPGDLDPEKLAVMLDEVDRVVAVAGNAGEAEMLGRVAAAAEGRNLEIVLVSDEARSASRACRPSSSSGSSATAPGSPTSRSRTPTSRGSRGTSRARSSASRSARAAPRGTRTSACSRFWKKTATPSTTPAEAASAGSSPRSSHSAMTRDRSTSGSGGRSTRTGSASCSEALSAAAPPAQRS